MNTISDFRSMNNYTATQLDVNKVLTQNPEAKKSDITTEQLLANRNSTEDALYKDEVNQSMSADFSSLVGLSGFSVLSISDNTPKIDTLVNMTQKYTKYINDNFDGDKKQNYLDSLSFYVNSTKESIASEISCNISKFFNLNAQDASDVKNNIGSIIDNKLNNITTPKKEATSFKDMNYDDLKILSAGIESISKSMYSDYYSSEDGTYQVASLGMAKMKANFIVAKTDLSTSIKTELSNCVDNKIIEEIGDISKKQEFVEKLREVFAKEKGFSLEDITGDNSTKILEKLKERTSNTYKKFKNVVFDKDFMNNVLGIMNDIKNQYSDDIDYYKKVDDKLGTGISKSLAESQSTITEKLNSDWNNFINKVYTGNDKSQYYLPSSNHNVVDSFA